MSPGVSFTPEEAEDRINTHACWNWLVTSGSTCGQNEERQDWGGTHFSRLPRLVLKREQPSVPHRFVVTYNNHQVLANWNELGTAIGNFIPPDASILLDTSHLGFDKLLYLLPALQACRPAVLACYYVAPVDFHEIETDALAVQDTLPIGQPKGYVALTAEETRANSQHVILLGFDKGRAWKFIQRYDWDEAHLHLLLGDPAFVINGERIALEACQPWLEPFLKRFPDHLHHFDARKPELVRDFLNMQLSQTHWLDIVPLGPKPMLLGVLAFYFGLSQEERTRVRLLYDFSEQRARRCNGVQMIHFWDCSGFPNK